MKTITPIEKKTCWYFVLVDKDTYAYILSHQNKISTLEKVFNGVNYTVYVYVGKYEGFLYLNENIENDNIYSKIPYPVYLTWDGWNEYQNDYYQKVPPRFQGLFREQAFISEEEMLDYINVQLPKIFKHIEDNNF